MRFAYLPPMSGLAANETRLDEGAVAVRIGEGRTAEVLRNLCWRAFQSQAGHWKRIVQRMQELFGVALDDPIYVAERGEITMSFRTDGVRLDLSASGRGQQQTLLLLTHMAANPGSVLLLDEPDAHLEILRQRQIYDLLRREIENYLCRREVLRAYASQVGQAQAGELFANTAVSHMDAAIDAVTEALGTLDKPDPFGPDAKVSDEFLDPVFREFFKRMQLPPTLMRKTDYHTLAPFLRREAIDAEVVEKLDAIVTVAQKARPVGTLPSPGHRR